MILNKLNEALVEIEAQRRILDAEEKGVRQLIAQLSGNAQSVVAPPLPPPLGVVTISEERDKLDEVADILRAEGGPLHINQIAERLSARLGKPQKRQQIEPGINRHIQKVKQARIAKFGPSTFGLPEWKTRTPWPAPEESVDVS